MNETSKPHHYLEGRDGYLSIVCEAPDDAPCRNECQREECQYEGCVCDDPRLKPLGFCNVMEWLHGDGIDQTADEFPGVPIIARWTGDGYRWRPESACEAR